MDQRRISIADINLGHPLRWDVFDANGNLLLRRGFIIERMQQVESLIKRGLFISAKSSGDKEEKTAAVEAPSTLRLINHANKRLERLLYNIESESDVQAKIIEIANTIIFATDLNTDIALACILLNQDVCDYAVRHGVDTAIVAMLVARSMQKPGTEVLSLMGAAMTMNIGMLRIQQGLQKKEGELTDAETDSIKNHPQDGVNMLRKAGIMDEEWLSCVLQHHENEDGSGYPLGKRSAEISENAKILAIADRYCARVSSRNYRKSLLPNAALRDIFLADKKHLDQTLAARFLRELGVYPTGTFVKLVNGEIGVVTGRGASTTTPVVHALIGPRGVPLSYPIKRDTRVDLYSIREVLYVEQAAIRFHMKQLWGEQASI